MSDVERLAAQLRAAKLNEKASEATYGRLCEEVKQAKRQAREAEAIWHAARQETISAIKALHDAAAGEPLATTCHCGSLGCTGHPLPNLDIREDR